MKRQDTYRRVGDLLTEHCITVPPVPVERIAVARGAQIVRSAADWSESGFLLRDDKKVIIGINSRNSARRQRFSIAHEIGHWLLHDEGQTLIVDQSVMLINKRDHISSQATHIQEIEANQFAAELLMPTRFIAHILEHMKADVSSRDELISALAQEFDVSSEAMGFRLLNLGVLSS